MTAPCRDCGVLSKVIIEAALLTDDEKVTACTLAKAAGADYVKTSTGFGPGGATAADVALMRRVVGAEMGVKAAGGVRDLEGAEGDGRRRRDARRRQRRREDCPAGARRKPPAACRQEQRLLVPSQVQSVRSAVKKPCASRTSRARSYNGARCSRAAASAASRTTRSRSRSSRCARRRSGCVPAITAGAAAPVLLLVVLVDRAVVGHRARRSPARPAPASAFSYYFLPPAGFAIERSQRLGRVRHLHRHRDRRRRAGGAGRAPRSSRRRRAAAKSSSSISSCGAAFDRASEAEAARRNEQLKAALLDALTHNLRTPLTAIKASVTALHRIGATATPRRLSTRRPARAAAGDRRGIRSAEPLHRRAVGGRSAATRRSRSAAARSRLDDDRSRRR